MLLCAQKTHDICTNAAAEFSGENIDTVYEKLFNLKKATTDKLT